MPFIPKSIEELCDQTKLKQADIARSLKVGPQTVCEWKKGNRGITTEHIDALYQLAKKYNVSIEFYEQPR